MAKETGLILVFRVFISSALETIWVFKMLKISPVKGLYLVTSEEVADQKLWFPY